LNFEEGIKIMQKWLITLYKNITILIQQDKIKGTLVLEINKDYHKEIFEIRKKVNIKDIQAMLNILDILVKAQKVLKTNIEDDLVFFKDTLVKRFKHLAELEKAGYTDEEFESIKLTPQELEDINDELEKTIRLERGK